MARRRRRRSFGFPASEHTDQAKSALREIRRLVGHVRSNLKSPPDCEQVARLFHSLDRESGVYLISKSAGNFRRAGGYGGAGIRSLFEKYVKACVVRPKSRAAARKMRAVWR